MIPRLHTIETLDSKPFAREFQSPEMAHAYILGLEDGMRALNAQRLFPDMNTYDTLRSLWREVKRRHTLTYLADPKE